MKITTSELKKIIAEEAAKLATEAPNIPDVMGAIGGGKFQPRHEVIEVVDSKMGDILFFSDHPVQISADGPSRKPDSDIGDWNALVKDLKLRPEDVTDTLIVQEPGHSMYELSHDEFAALELALEKEKNPSLKNISYTPDTQKESVNMNITKRKLRRIIREATEEVTMYDQGREDSLAGIRPQLPDEDYMMGYNEAQADAGLPKMQAPSDSGRGKKLDPSKLKGAFAGKQRGSRPGEIELDFGKDIGTYNYIDESQVKITKRQLRKIIREEKAKFLSEGKPSEMSMHDAAEYYEQQRSTSMGQTAKTDELFDARDNLLGILETLPPNEAVAYINSLIEELQSMKRQM